jgi:hypothetical protein
MPSGTNDSAYFKEFSEENVTAFSALTLARNVLRLRSILHHGKLVCLTLSLLTDQ